MLIFCALQIGCFCLIILTSLSHHFKWNTVLIWRNALFSKTLNVNLLECHPGYNGQHCTIQCPYPTYGELCQGYCNCRKENCDVSTGCRAPTTGIYTILRIICYFSNQLLTLYSKTFNSLVLKILKKHLE